MTGGGEQAGISSMDAQWRSGVEDVGGNKSLWVSDQLPAPLVSARTAGGATKACSCRAIGQCTPHRLPAHLTSPSHTSNRYFYHLSPPAARFPLFPLENS